MKLIRSAIAIVVLATASAYPAFAHTGEGPSVHDVVAGVLDRMKAFFEPETLTKLTVGEATAFLKDDERLTLATQYLVFRVNTAAVVSVMHDARLKDDPYWLQDLGFEKTAETVTVEDGRAFNVWQKTVRPGMVGLGVNSVSGGGDHYFVGVAPVTAGEAIEVTEVYPALHHLAKLDEGSRPWTDESDKITAVPASLKGQTLIQGVDERADDARLINIFRLTPYPADTNPDHIALTWSGDPKTTQTIQWRTSTEVAKGAVAYIKKSEYQNFNRKEPAKIEAETTIVDANLVNQPEIHRHTATLTELEPGTDYLYAVGDGSDDGWTVMQEFTTAPDHAEPFKFVYMGDAQNGLERWGSLIQHAHRESPEAAFYVMAGDLVNRGNDRDDWDSFFENAEGVYSHRNIVPVPGNHEYQGGACNMYLGLFKLPESSPVGEKAWTFEYSNALFVMLDSNLPVSTQTEWLDEQLAKSTATWKFVVYHHPAYSSSPNRNNADVRKEWGGVFDKYHVDLALQGHDHAYLRTYPMKAEQKAGSAADGTIYIVSVSGTKFYEQGNFDYTEVGMTKVATYQVLDIQIDGDRLVYRAIDVDGKVRDEFVIEK